MKKGIKKLILGTFSAFLMTVGLSSCHDVDEPGDYEVDYVPLEFCFTVENAAGENLLDPTTPGNILDTEMRLLYHGRDFKVLYGYPSAAPTYPRTRSLPVFWYGAYIAPHSISLIGLDITGPNHLYVGQFYIVTGNNSFELLLNGKQYEVSYSIAIDPKDPLNVTKHYYLDGVEMPSEDIKIIM